MAGSRSGRLRFLRRLARSSAWRARALMGSKTIGVFKPSTADMSSRVLVQSTKPISSGVALATKWGPPLSATTQAEGHALEDVPAPRAAVRRASIPVDHGRHGEVWHQVLAVARRGKRISAHCAFSARPDYDNIIATPTLATMVKAMIAVMPLPILKSSMNEPLSLPRIDHS